MHGVIRSISLDPEPTALPADPAAFCVLARMLVGPDDGPGEESFDVTVCSPEWLAVRCSEVGFYDARHHLVVRVEEFDRRELVRFLARRVQAATGTSWDEVGQKIARLGAWELEDLSAPPGEAR